MADKYDNIDDLLARKFAGETSADEEAQLAAWLKADPKNARYLEEMSWVWAAAGQAQPDMPDVDTEAALKKVKAQLRPARGFRWSYFGWILLLLAFAGASVWLYQQHEPAPQPEIIMASSNVPMSDTLTDGSTVVLNRHSSIVVEAGFNGKDRRTRLTGEAYFQVKPDKTRPFVVAVDQLEVRVVGTAFNILENRDRGKIEITVTEGRVQLKSRIQEEFIGAGESAIFDIATGQIEQQSQPNPNALAYQNRKFRFNDVVLSEVAEQLTRVYDVDIVFQNPVLKDCHLLANFDNLRVEQIIDIIADTFGLTVTRNGNTFLLNGEGCE